MFAALQRRRQRDDVARLNKLALLSRGEVTAAAVLAARTKGIETIEAAVRYVTAHPEKVQARLRSTGFQYFDHVARTMDRIRVLVSQIDFDKIAALERADQPTSRCFFDVIRQIQAQITHEHGALRAIDRIFKTDSINATLPVTTLQILAGIRKTCIAMRKTCWTIRHPFFYMLTDKRVILAVFCAGVAAIPVWYLVRVQASAVAPNAPPPTIIVNDDIAELRRLLRQPELGVLDRLVQISQFIFNTLLSVPSLFFLAAAVIAASRKYLVTGGRGRPVLQRYESMLSDLGQSLQKHLPNASLITIRDINVSKNSINAAGGIVNQNDHSTQTVGPQVLRSDAAARDKHSAESEELLKAVSALIAANPKPGAAEKFERIRRELEQEQPDRDVLHALWDRLTAILPAVANVGAATEAVAKLLQQ